MRTVSFSKSCSYMLAVVLGTSLCLACPAYAEFWGSYIVDLNNKEATLIGAFTFGRAINDSGQVVGSVDHGSSHAFTTGPNGIGVIDLSKPGESSSYALGINDAGQVVGWSQTTSLNGFVTGPAGLGRTDFAPGAAAGINNMGRIVGRAGDGHAFITGPNGVGLTDLGTLGGNGSFANGINAAGQVVGEAQLISNNGFPHAFITGPNGVGMTDLGTLGGSYSTAYGINDTGQVVGASFTVDNNMHPFITGPNGIGMSDLGPPREPSRQYSEAFGINNAGQVVGYFNTTNGGSPHAFVTGPDGMGMTDLNSLMHLPNGAIFVEAHGINNQGQIIALAFIPEPATYALMLTGLAFVVIAVRVNKGTRSTTNK